MDKYFGSEWCTGGLNSIDAYVSSILRGSFPEMEFSREAIFTEMSFSEDIRECLLALEQLDSVVEVAKRELNPACSRFSKSSVSGSYHGTVRMADGSVKRLDLVLTAIEDNNCKNLCSCVVAMFTSGGKNELEGYDICYSIKAFESGKCVVGAVEF